MAQGMKNKYGPWVSGRDFFNRDKEVAQLADLINEGSNILVVAPRRVGKTSLIRETFRRLDEDQTRYHLFVDVQHCSTPEDVITAISMETAPYTALHQKILGVLGAFWKQIQDNIESIGSKGVLEIKIREGLKGDWQAKGRDIMENLAKADRPVTVCLDELPIMLSRLLGNKTDADYQQKRKEADVFLAWLRSIMGTNQGTLGFIICGSIGLEPILKRHGLSHTITQLRPFVLDPWDRSTARDCLAALSAGNSIVLPGPTRERMLDHLGVYVPHHVQMFFGHVHEDCAKRDAREVSVDDVDRVYQKSMLSTRGHAELADYEERLLRVLEKETVPLALDFLTEAAVKGGFTAETAGLIAGRSQLSAREETIREVIEILQHDGYLERDEATGEWRFVSHLLRDWWKRRFQESYLEPREGR
jgi:uncharacterized protein